MSFLIIKGLVLNEKVFADSIVPAIHAARRDTKLERYEISRADDRVIILGVFDNAIAIASHEATIIDLMKMYSASVRIDDVALINVSKETVARLASASSRRMIAFSSVGSIVPAKQECKQYACSIM